MAGTTDTNTLLTSDVTTNREDLADQIWMVSPEYTPLTMLSESAVATNQRHEWSTDKLGAVNNANANLQGQRFSATQIVVPVRLFNQCQIAIKEIEISQSEIKSHVAGADDLMDYETIKATKELKRDIEGTLLANNGATAAANAVPGVLRGLPSWITTNVTATVSNAGNGTPTTGRTTGTLGPISESLVDAELLQVYQNSEYEVTTIMLSPKNKVAFSGFTGPSGATRMIRTDEKILTTAIDYYESDFGRHKVLPNRYQRGSDVFFINEEYIAVAWFRELFVQDMPPTGDNMLRSMRAEYTLEIRNEAALGLLADTNG
jgi:hypothetical protein